MNKKSEHIEKGNHPNNTYETKTGLGFAYLCLTLLEYIENSFSNNNNYYYYLYGHLIYLIYVIIGLSFLKIKIQL